MPPAAAVYARTLTDVPTRTPGGGRHEPNKNERSLTEGACPRSYLASVLGSHTREEIGIDVRMVDFVVLGVGIGSIV